MSMRWTIRRKAALLEQIRSGELSELQVLAAHDLSIIELREWQRRYDAAGPRGLRVTRRLVPLLRLRPKEPLDEARKGGQN